MRALDGLNVLEIADGPAVGLAAVVLGDFGADVLRIDASAPDRLDNADDRYAPLLRRSKRCHPEHLDRWPATRLEQSFATADLVLTQGDPLWHAQPSLPRTLDGFGCVHCHVNGLESEFAACPAEESVVAAHIGRMQQFAALAGADEADRPVYAALQVGTHATAMSLVFGALAALLERRRSGRGRYLVTSLERGLQPYDIGGSLALQLPHDPGANMPDRRLPKPPRALPFLNYHPVQARDGIWLQLGNLLPHLLAEYFAVADLNDALPPKWPHSPAAWDDDAVETMRDRMFARMQQRDASDWMRGFIDNGNIVAHPYQTTQEALDDPDIVENGHVVHVADPYVGTCRQVGPIARMTATPGEPRAPSSDIDGWGTATTHGPARNATAPAGAGPLDGVTVIEFATIIAAPMGASFLADLGARVIKVESPQGDPFRWMGNGIGAHRVNGGKESIAVDLKAPEAGPIVRGLLARADIVIHNFRPGVPERLGIGYNQAAALNPSVVYLAANGYGPDGPGAKRPSTHPIPGAALGGVLWQVGGRPESALLDNAALRETARRLFAANELNPDPNTAVVIAAAAMIGLWAARVHGVGQLVQTDMFIANAWANWDDFLAFEGKTERPALDHALLGLSALQRLYECASGWVFLHVATTSDWRRFCALADHDPDDFSPEALATTLRGRTADEWTTRMLGAGVGCTKADDRLPGEWYARRAHNMVPVTQPSIGAFKRHGPQIEAAGTEWTLRPAPDPGADTIALALEAGCTDDQIEPLLQAGILVG